MRRLVVLVAAVLGVAGTLPASAETAEVAVRDSYFTPDFRVLVPGDTATWIHQGALEHTITSYPDAPKTFDSSPNVVDTCEPPDDDGGLLGGDDPVAEPDCLAPGSEPYSVTFETVGTWDYYCKIHGNPDVRPEPSANAAAQPCGMCGRILVKAPSSARPAAERPDPEPTSTIDDGDDEPSPSASASPSPGASGSFVASSPIADSGAGGSAAVQLLLAAVALSVLIGLGYVVWRRYFQTA